MSEINVEKVLEHTMADSMKELGQKKAYFEDEDTTPPAA